MRNLSELIAGLLHEKGFTQVDAANCVKEVEVSSGRKQKITQSWVSFVVGKKKREWVEVVNLFLEQLVGDDYEIRIEKKEKRSVN